MRGEHKRGKRGGRSRTGSSPRARGTRHRGHGAVGVVGIIPACAGNTRALRGEASRRRDHPRVRGEHVGAGERHSSQGGSSPRARGTRLRLRRLSRPRGIIPACAGNTASWTSTSTRCWDHPRVRGEHRRFAVETWLDTGSSPRARGTRLCPICFPMCWRIIPACAGNTRRVTTTRVSARDHPRVRGEHAHVILGNAFLGGSSPRARGTPQVLPEPAGGTGIIPACAGNTAPSARPLPRCRDHPRVRGEHCSRVSRGCPRWGSSPRARGTRLPPPAGPLGRGIIPACAGNTSESTSTAPRSRDHPRVRGEHM